MSVRCIVAIEKFRDYVLKPGADQGKLPIFQSLGYTQEHSELLVETYTRQAFEKFERKDFHLGKKDLHGQRVTIEVVLSGVGESSDKVSYVASGWLLVDANTIRLTTPFAGFTRSQGQNE